MGVVHQLARLTAQSPPIISLPGGGLPTVTKEMVAQAAASLDDDLAYHLVMGLYTDSILSKNLSLELIEAESKRIWRRKERGTIRKKNSFTLMVILAHAIYFQNPEGHRNSDGSSEFNSAKERKRSLTATEKAKFCELSESGWHDKWGIHFHDLMLCLQARESNLLRWIGKNIWTE